MVCPDFEAIQGETYHQQFAKDSILCREVDENRTMKLLTKQDSAVLKRLLVKFRLHLKESGENIEKYGKGDVLIDHSVFISDVMTKRVLALQSASKHEKNKNARSEHFLVTVTLFKKGLVAFENQQTPLRRHLARLEYAKSPEGAAYFKEKAREELSVLVRERIDEFKRREAELDKEEAAKKKKEASEVDVNDGEGKEGREEKKEECEEESGQKPDLNE